MEFYSLLAVCVWSCGYHSSERVGVRAAAGSSSVVPAAIQLLLNVNDEMGWEYREGEASIWHTHKIGKYDKRRYYMPDLVTREEWGAKPPFDWYEPFKHPVKKVLILYTNTEFCTSLESCSKIIRDIQNEHLDLGLMDIAYNYMIGGDGRKYEGRGWYVRSEKPVRSLKRRCKRFTIAYIGSFREFRKKIPNPILDAKENLLTHGASHDYLTCCYDVKKQQYGDDNFKVQDFSFI